MKPLSAGTVTHVKLAELHLTRTGVTAVIELVGPDGVAVADSGVQGFGEKTLTALRELGEIIEADFAAHLALRAASAPKNPDGEERVAPFVFGPHRRDVDVAGDTPPRPTTDGRVYDAES